MIAIAATVQPREAPLLLGVVLNRLTSRFAPQRTRDDRTVVQIPALGRVLITQERASMRLDFVVATEEAATIAVTALEDEIRAGIRDRDISLRWDRPAIVPAALR